MNCPICDNVIDATMSSCPACGFKLMSATQQFAPVSSSSKEANEPIINLASLVPDISAPSENDRAAMFTVVRGPQIGSIFPVCGRMVIGRNPHCDIFLNDMTVSREHAVIERQANGYRLTDRNSYNGVWVNDEMIESAVLRDGDMVQFGSFTLKYTEKTYCE